MCLGALDGGLDIHHNEKRFVVFSRGTNSLDVDVHRKYIYEGAAPVQAMTQYLGVGNADLQQVPTLKLEIEGLRRELQHASAAWFQDYIGVQGLISLMILKDVIAHVGPGVLEETQVKPSGNDHGNAG
ncbi:60S ribosomal protein L5 [Tanacetum coccineum]